MTQDEIKKVAKILLTADSWCSNCQAGLFDQLLKAFPEHETAIKYVRSRAAVIEDAYRGMQYSVLKQEGWVDPDSPEYRDVWDFDL